MAAARQQVIAQQTAVDRALIDLNTAQRELKRATELIEKGVASRFEYDAARDRYDQAKVALDTAKANLESQRLAVKEAVERANQQRAAVKEAQTSVKTSEMRASQQQAMLRGQSSQRQKATQYSPLNGVVADIPTRVGEFAVSQLSSTPLMTIALRGINRSAVDTDPGYTCWPFFMSKIFRFRTSRAGMKIMTTITMIATACAIRRCGISDVRSRHNISAPMISGGVAGNRNRVYHHASQIGQSA